MADAQYRTIAGFVKFPPRDGEVDTKDGEVAIRNIVVRNVGVKEQAIDVRATLWPSHEDVEVEQGDFVVLEGKFTTNKGEKDGEPVTFFNLSVSTIKNFGGGDEGNREPRSSDAGSSQGDSEDDIPW